MRADRLGVSVIRRGSPARGLAESESLVSPTAAQGRSQHCGVSFQLALFRRPTLSAIRKARVCCCAAADCSRHKNVAAGAVAAQEATYRALTPLMANSAAPFAVDESGSTKSTDPICLSGCGLTHSAA